MIGGFTVLDEMWCLSLSNKIQTNNGRNSIRLANQALQALNGKKDKEKKNLLL